MDTQLFNLTGKTAIVTGASRGIGEATALLLADFGAHVVVTSRKQEACEAVVEKIRGAGGVATALATHIGDSASIDNLYQKLADRGFGVDILVNNAATNPYFGPMLDMGLDAFDKTVEVNIRGYYYATLEGRARRCASAAAARSSISPPSTRAAPRPVAGRVFDDQGRDRVDDRSLRQGTRRPTASASTRCCPASPRRSSPARSPPTSRSSRACSGRCRWAGWRSRPRSRP